MQTEVGYLQIMIYRSSKFQDTIKIGARFAKSLQAGAVVALIGDLGAGKTVFTKGIAQGLGVKDIRYVNSPTFVLTKEHKGRIPLYHFDLYRIDHPGMVDLESWDEIFYGDGVSVVEWADKISALLPTSYYEVTIARTGEDSRKITIKKVERAVKW